MQHAGYMRLSVAGIDHEGVRLPSGNAAQDPKSRVRASSMNSNMQNSWINATAPPRVWIHMVMVVARAQITEMNGPFCAFAHSVEAIR